MNNQVRKITLKNIRMLLLIILPIILTAESCEDRDDKIIGNEDYRFELFNKSDRSVYIDFGYTYPDTSIGTYHVADDPVSFKVLPDQEKSIMVRCCWEGIFSSQIESDTLMVFIFEASVIESTPWDTVKVNYLVLKRYDLSLQDLQSMNWTITYP